MDPIPVDPDHLETILRGYHATDTHPGDTLGRWHCACGRWISESEDTDGLAEHSSHVAYEIREALAGRAQA